MPSNRVEKQKRVFFVFVKFVRKMQFIFTLTNDGFDPDLTSMLNVNNGGEKASALGKSR